MPCPSRREGQLSLAAEVCRFKLLSVICSKFSETQPVESDLRIRRFGADIQDYLQEQNSIGETGQPRT